MKYQIYVTFGIVAIYYVRSFLQTIYLYNYNNNNTASFS